MAQFVRHPGLRIARTTASIVGIGDCVVVRTGDDLQPAQFVPCQVCEEEARLRVIEDRRPGRIDRDDIRTVLGFTHLIEDHDLARICAGAPVRVIGCLADHASRSVQGLEFVTRLAGIDKL